MNILVLNGSPKGKHSVTLQTALYWEKRYPQHSFHILPVAQQIRKYETDFTPVVEAVSQAELVLFSYPVYTFLAPYQLHRFLELMYDQGLSLKGKYVAQLSTSKHFYDVTAHKYIQENVLDLGGRYLGGFSADMEDLLTVQGRRQADCFFQKLLFDWEQGIYQVAEPQEPVPLQPYQASLPTVEQTGTKDVVIVTNLSEADESLSAMIADFQATCPHPTRIINLREFPFAGGCVGCMSCTTSATCIYKDGFDQFLRQKIQQADAIVQAFTIQHHYTHSSLKCYDDRQFCNGHRTVTQGMPTAYLIHGHYHLEQNLQTLVEARSQVGGLYLAGVATTQGGASSIVQVCQSLDYALNHQMELPSNFYGVGGTKIFRDLVYLMQGLMEADHKFYKLHGIYDFPHNQRGKILQMKLLGSLMALPSVQKKMKGKLSGYILAPYTKLLDQITPVIDD